MKAKLIQIALGSLGSILTVLIQYYAGGSVDPVVAVAGGVGTNALLGDVVPKLFV